MKKLLIALATTVALVGTAHTDWQCGEVTVEVNKITSDHLAEVKFTGFFRDLLVREGFKFQFTKDGGAKLTASAANEEVPDRPRDDGGARRTRGRRRDFHLHVSGG